MNREEKQEQVEIGIPSIGIPSEVAFNPRLIASEKQLFGIIRNLAKTDKGCTASNRYLANCIDSVPQTASNHINKLKKFLYIIVKFKNKKNTDTKEQERTIYINPDYMKIYEPVRGLMHKVYVKNYSPLKNELYRAIDEVIREYSSIYKKGDIEKDIEKDDIVDKSTIVADPADLHQIDSTSSPVHNGKEHPTVAPYIDYWNSLPNVNHHHRLNTKTRQEASALLLSLKAGTFHRRNTLNKEWMEKFNIPIGKVRGRRFTDNEIRKGLKLVSRLLTNGYGYLTRNGNGYWPSETDKQKLPKNLPAVLFSPKSGKSLFLRCLFDPPRPLGEIEPQDPSPEMTEMFAALMPNRMGPQQKTALIRNIGELRRFHAGIDWARANRVSCYYYYIGRRDDFKTFCTYYVKWLKTSQEEGHLRVGPSGIGPGAGHWPRYCQFLCDERGQGFNVMDGNKFFKN